VIINDKIAQNAVEPGDYGIFGPWLILGFKDTQKSVLQNVLSNRLIPESSLKEVQELLPHC
jgi:hypothetical protein